MSPATDTGLIEMMQMRFGRSLLGILAITVAALVWPTTVAAQANTVKETAIETDILNTCTGELVHFSGVQTTTSIVNYDSAGGLHMSGAMVTKGTAIGTSTGTNYAYRENDLFKVKIAPSENQNMTIKLKSRLRGPGAIDDWDFTFHVHFTINATGVLSSYIDTFETHCRG